MNVLIIEDEMPTALDLQATLQDVDPDLTVVGILDSVESAIDYFRSRPAPELVFLDIQLADGLSFEIFREVDVAAPVIFCTAFDEYALQAFRTNGVDYLLKPFDRGSVGQALAKVRRLRHYLGGVPGVPLRGTLLTRFYQHK